MWIKKRQSSYLYGFIVINVIWYLVASIVKLPIIQSPIKVFINVFEIFPSTIAIHAFFSIARIIGGVLLSMIIGIPLGILMGYFKEVDKILSPIIYFIYPVPKIALLPVIMLIFGLGESSKLVMIIIIIIFQIIVAARDAVKNIPREIYYSMYSLGASKLQIVKEIIIPASFSEILTSIRVALGTAVSILFFTETFGTEYGMGYFIMDAWMRVNYLEMYSGIVVLSVIGFCLFISIDIIEKFVCSWKQ